MQYRPEIDGMRAVAVVAVLLDHAKVGYFSGGFIGVDVFFVISGFLLTFITIGDIKNRRFSLWRFYERRIRRIIPALLVVCSVTTLAAFLALSPESARHYLGSLAATLLFGANFYFYFEADYFAPSSDLELLLHTWSLGVEEQFYLFFPALFVFFYTRKQVVAAAAVAFGASLCLALSAGDDNAVFYLLPYRVWEFAVGAMIAIYQHKESAAAKRTIFPDLAAAFGLLLIIASAVFVPEGGESFYLIPPVFGAGLIIMYGRDSIFCRYALANPVMIYVGSISYSLYLWHQPIFAIARERSLNELQFIDYVPLLALAFLLSHLTYRLVETPFRNRQRMSLPRVPLYLAGLAAPMLVLWPVLNAGITRSSLMFDDNVGAYITYTAAADRSKAWSAMNDYGSEDAHVEIAVVGNSHARDMWNALRLSPLSETAEFIPLVAINECKLSRKDRYLSLILPRRDAFEAVRNCETTYPFLERYLDTVAGVVIAPLWDEDHIDYLPSLISSINKHGIPVLVAGNTARFNNVPQAARNVVEAGLSEVTAINDAVEETRLDQGAVNNRLRMIARQNNAIFLDRESLVCPATGCDLTFAYGHFTLFDSHHWTIEGATRFAARLYETEALREFMDRVTAHRQSMAAE